MCIRDSYYPVLAQTGTPEAVASLLAGFREGDRGAAFAEMCIRDSAHSRRQG